MPTRLHAKPERVQPPVASIPAGRPRHNWVRPIAPGVLPQLRVEQSYARTIRAPLPRLTSRVSRPGANQNRQLPIVQVTRRPTAGNPTTRQLRWHKTRCEAPIPALPHRQNMDIRPLRENPPGSARTGRQIDSGPHSRTDTRDHRSSTEQQRNPSQPAIATQEKRLPAHLSSSLPGCDDNARSGSLRYRARWKNNPA